MNFDEQDVLFNILDRNEIKEVRAFIAYSQFGRETIEVEVTPKRKFPNKKAKTDPAIPTIASAQNQSTFLSFSGLSKASQVTIRFSSICIYCSRKTKNLPRR
jgi:hypothetical protein